MSIILSEYFLLRRKQIKDKTIVIHTHPEMIAGELSNSIGFEKESDLIFSSEMVCRVCMNPATISVLTKINNYPIISAIRNVANIVISHDDSFPKYICQTCLEDLKIAVNFKQKCESSDYKLRMYLNQKFPNDITPMTYHDFQLILHQMAQRRIKKTEACQERITKNTKINTLSIDIQKHKTVKGSKCIPCDLVFTSKVELLNHQQKRSCIRSPCLTCGKLVLNLKAHTRLAHESTSVFSCHVCGKTTKTAALLKSHLLVHSNKKEYSCPMCPYKGKQRAYLSLHMRTHTGERPYLCSQCPATFVNASNLKKHQLIHSTKRFKCQECKKLFRCKKTLKDHFDAMHLNLRYPCNICGRELWNRAKLLRHEIRMHNREKHKLNDELSKVIASNISDVVEEQNMYLMQNASSNLLTATKDVHFFSS